MFKIPPFHSKHCFQAREFKALCVFTGSGAKTWKHLFSRSVFPDTRGFLQTSVVWAGAHSICLTSQRAKENKPEWDEHWWKSQWRPQTWNTGSQHGTHRWWSVIKKTDRQYMCCIRWSQKSCSCLGLHQHSLWKMVLLFVVHIWILFWASFNLWFNFLPSVRKISKVTDSRFSVFSFFYALYVWKLLK